MDHLVDYINERTPLGPPGGRAVVIAGLFLAAWLLSRIGGLLAVRLVARRDRRRRAPQGRGEALLDLKQRQTAMSLLRTSVRYAVYGAALVLALATLAGAQRQETLIGASFAALVVAFAAQRFLADVIAGLLMVFERWFRVGDAIRIEPFGLQGVVEEISLRTTVVRGAGGELLRIVNSELKAATLLPRGFTEYEIELYTDEEEIGRAAFARAAALAPVGPTHFVTAPEIVDVDHLGDDLVRLRARAAVPPGREELARDLLPLLIKERAPKNRILHGPIVVAVDDEAKRRFGRALNGGDPARP